MSLDVELGSLQEFSEQRVAASSLLFVLRRCAAAGGSDWGPEASSEHRQSSGRNVHGSASPAVQHSYHIIRLLVPAHLHFLHPTPPAHILSPVHAAASVSTIIALNTQPTS